MQLGCVDLRAMRQCCNTGCGERWQAEPAGHSLACQPAQGEPQRIVRHKGVVAIGDQQEHRQVLDPSAEVAQQIQRCLISPVDVLDGDNSKSFQAVELTQQCAIQPVPFRVNLAKPEQLTTQLSGDIE